MEEQRPITLGDWLDLQEDMHAAELLLEDAHIAPADIAGYWAISAELLALLQEIDDYLRRRAEDGPAPDEGDVYLGMRRRFTAVLAKAEELSGAEGSDE